MTDAEDTIDLSKKVFIAGTAFNFLLNLASLPDTTLQNAAISFAVVEIVIFMVAVMLFSQGMDEKEEEKKQRELDNLEKRIEKLEQEVDE